MYIVIEHINGEINSDPFIIYNEIDLEEYLYDGYLIYSLNDCISDLEKNISILKEYKK